ncbi:hypothetical protein ACA910_002908 [Epithemia clementina (nom. ined.)]
MSGFVNLERRRRYEHGISGIQHYTQQSKSYLQIATKKRTTTTTINCNGGSAGTLLAVSKSSLVWLWDNVDADKSGGYFPENGTPDFVLMFRTFHSEDATFVSDTIPSALLGDGGGAHSSMALVAHNSNNVGNSLDNVLSDQDVMGGLILALCLACLGAYLQSLRNRNDFVVDLPVLPPRNYVGSPSNNDKNDSTTVTLTTTNDSISDQNQTTMATRIATSAAETTTNNMLLFDDWKEMSRPDNYIWYKIKDNNRMREKNNPSSGSTIGSNNLENRWVVVGLLAFFVPIFFFEFFLTASRQILCSGIPFWDQAQSLCEAYTS